MTLLQATRSSGKDEIFTFVVDESITNLAVCITGTSVDVSLTDPSGDCLSVALNLITSKIKAGV